jgi:DNA repair ATPase RecN
MTKSDICKLTHLYESVEKPWSIKDPTGKGPTLPEVRGMTLQQVQDELQRVYDREQVMDQELEEETERLRAIYKAERRYLDILKAELNHRHRRAPLY